MGVKPNECIVVEDSITGVIAAVRAKIKVYALVKLHSAEDLQNAGAIPIRGLKDLSDLMLMPE